MGGCARPARNDRLVGTLYRMWSGWLLKHPTLGERGAAPAEMTFAIVLLMTLALGVMQVAFALYARNVIAASAHEGARAALERGRTRAEAASIARAVVSRATGRLIEDLAVDVAAVGTAQRRTVIVRVKGIVTDFGPVPLPIVLSSTATAHMDEALRK